MTTVTSLKVYTAVIVYFTVYFSWIDAGALIFYAVLWGSVPLFTISFIVVRLSENSKKNNLWLITLRYSVPFAVFWLPFRMEGVADFLPIFFDCLLPSFFAALMIMGDIKRQRDSEWWIEEEKKRRESEKGK